MCVLYVKRVLYSLAAVFYSKAMAVQILLGMNQLGLAEQKLAQLLAVDQDHTLSKLGKYT